MNIPIISHDLAEKLERSEIEYMTDRMEAIRQRSGNPEGVEIRTFGGCTAFYSRTMPWGQFNNVKGLGASDIPVLDDIIRFYKERERKFEFQITPSKSNAELMKQLHDRGFYQSGFHTTLYAEAGMVGGEDPADIAVRELREDEFELYGLIHCLGSGLPRDGAVPIAQNNAVLYHRPGWKFFLGLAGDKPAAVGVMVVKGEVASFTFAATLPEYRKRGLHTALLRRRMAEAVKQGCRWVVGQAAYASSSHRNMERIGMRIGYTRATWTSRH